MIDLNFVKMENTNTVWEIKSPILNVPIVLVCIIKRKHGIVERCKVMIETVKNNSKGNQPHYVKVKK